MYSKVRADALRRNGMGLEDAICFCERVERKLAVLDEREQETILWQAMGYTQLEIAEMSGCSQGTITSRMQNAKGKLFAELIAEIGKMPTMPRNVSLGRKIGRPRSNRPGRG